MTGLERDHHTVTVEAHGTAGMIEMTTGVRDTTGMTMDVRDIMMTMETETDMVETEEDGEDITETIDLDSGDVDIDRGMTTGHSDRWRFPTGKKRNL